MEPTDFNPPNPNPPVPAPAPANLPVPAAPEPPRAATVVAEGKTARELELERKLEEKDKLVKAHEQSIAELADANRTLKESSTPRAPKKKKSCLEAFLAGEDWT